MTTSEKNRYSKSTDITPDLVVQKSGTSGFIAECKWGLPRDERICDVIINEITTQLEKYDDDLSGWPISPNANAHLSHDLIILANHGDSKQLISLLKQRRDNGIFSLSRAFAVVSVVQSQRAEGIWPVLDLEEGSLSDTDKSAKLSGRILIDPTKLALNPQIALVELCDTAPPIPVMMDLIYRAAIRELPQEGKDKNRLDGEVNQVVSLNEIVGWLKPFSFVRTDSRDCVCPKVDWIRSAMATFMAIEWAEKSDATKDEWTFLHKRGRKETYSKFVKFCADLEFKKAISREKKEAKDTERTLKKKLRDEAKLKARQEREEKKKSRVLAKAREEIPLFADLIEKNLTAEKQRPLDGK